MRRRFIDGKGGAVERWVTKFAHSRPLVLEHGFVGMRFMTYEQYLLGLGDKPGPKYLNLPPGVVPPAERPHTGASSSGEELTGRL
ncbi:MAG TPA: hypothetical protein VK688_09365, partial [Gemmatimonadales bacterium]|nr:hypothetical protein [Gemmatimonadales bacterium]